jgi:hypothetical protein
VLICSALASVCLVASIGTLARGQDPAPSPVPTPAAITTPTSEQAAAAQAKQRAERRARARKVRSLHRWIKRHRETTWYWQDVMQKPHIRRPYARAASVNLRYLKKVARVWKKRARKARYLAHHPPHKWLWLCIHGREGSWTDNASNNPHWGGLQMGEWFMWHYAARLRAKLGKDNSWPKLMQIWVAENAYRREGYSRSWLLGQWVPTASYCI